MTQNIDSRAFDAYVNFVHTRDDVDIDGRPLESGEKLLTRRVLDQVPAIAGATLPPGATVTDLVAIIAKLGDRLGQTIRSQEQAQNELRDLRFDLNAVRRVLGTDHS